MLSNLQNNKIVNGKGVITITGQIMFGHNANHVTPVVLFDGVLVEEEVVNLVDENASVDIEVLQQGLPNAWVVQLGNWLHTVHC